MSKLNVFGDKYMQYLATFLVSILSVNVGLCMSWPSPTLPLLQSKDSPIGVTLTTVEGSWVAALLLLGMVAGNLVSGSLMDKFGRRGVLLMSAAPIFGTWMMILMANSVVLLYLARFIGGAATVFPVLTSVIYIGEISEPSIRGKLGMFNLLMVELGHLIITSVGSYMSYSSTAIIASVFPVVFVIVFYWMPESPYYYLRTGQIENAKMALKRLRGNTDIDKEILEMQVNVENDMNNKSSWGELILSPKYRRPVFIIIGLKTIQQLNGVAAITSYMKIIFNQASTGLDSSQSAIICTAVTLPAIFVGSLLIDKFGRKPLYYVSTTGCTIAVGCEAMYFYMQNGLNRDMSSFGWLPLFGVIFFNISRVIGVHTMPYILASELFTTNIKGIGTGISFVYSGLLAFLVLLLFPYVVEAWGMYVCFFIFMGICVLGIPFTMILIPETKGKSLQGIQNDMEIPDSK